MANDRFTNLYFQAMQQKINKNRYMNLNLDEECTFQPTLYTKGRNKSRKPALDRARSANTAQDFSLSNSSFMGKKNLKTIK